MYKINNLCLIVARLTSNRLPQKQLRLIDGQPLIFRIVERLKLVPNIDKVILATGPEAENKELAEYLSQFNIETYYDEDVNDVTGRIARAANYYEAENVVMVSGDCPLIDPEFITKALNLLNKNNCDYVSVDLNKYECIHEGIVVRTADMWNELDKHSVTPAHKEHPGSVFKEIKDKFVGCEYELEPEFRRHDFRMSVDTNSDLEFMNVVFGELSKEGSVINLKDVVKLIDLKPELKSINQHVLQKKIEDKSFKILIRCDGGKKWGLGHIYRTQAIASELVEKYAVGIVFAVKEDEIGIKLLTDSFFTVVKIPESIPEGEWLLSFTDVNSFDAVIFDSRTNISPEVLKQIMNRTKVVTLDDPEDKRLNTHLAISPLPQINNKSNWKDYKGELVSGFHFVPLRKIFAKDYVKLRNRIPKVFLSMGGSDPFNLIFLVLDFLKKVNSPFSIKCVIGKANINEKEIAAYCKDNDIEINLIKDPANIAEEMSECDLAVISFGMIAYEIASLGIPAIYICISADHNKSAEIFVENGCAINLGVYDKIESNNAVDKIKDLLQDQNLREKMSNNCKALNIREGTTNCANRIMSLVNN